MTQLVCRLLLLASLGALLALPLCSLGAPLFDGSGSGSGSSDDGELSIITLAPVGSGDKPEDDDTQGPMMPVSGQVPVDSGYTQGPAPGSGQGPVGSHDTKGPVTVTAQSITVKNITDKNGKLVGYYFDEVKNKAEEGKGIFQSIVDKFAGIFTSDDDKHRSGEQHGQQQQHSGGDKHNDGKGNDHHDNNSPSASTKKISPVVIPAINGIHGAPPSLSIGHGPVVVHNASPHA